MTQVIVVGAGMWGKNLIQNFYDLGSLAGVVEIDNVLRDNVTNSYPDVPVYQNYQEALEQDIPAFVLGTPAPTHYNLAMKALQAGKDVFVEKPMTLQRDEAKSLADYADQQFRILMVGHLLLYHPAIAWMQEYLASGKAGNILHISTQRVKLGKVRREENVWWSFAPHDVSVVLHLLGQPELKNVFASGHAMLQNNIEDNVHVDLVFAGGQTAHIHCSWYWPVMARNTVVIGDKQMLVYDEILQKITIYDKGVDQDFNNRDGGGEVVELPQSQPLRIECQHFLDCVKSRQRPISDGWNGVAVVEILEKATELLNG